MSWTFPEKPFIGLRPFFQEDNILFFGRREQTQELLKRLHDNRFLAVIGSSGSGKSSLVRAGLVPQLSGGVMVGDRDTWLVSTMKPGDDPIYSLAEELVSSSGTPNPERSKELKEAIDAEGLKAVLEFVKPHLEKRSANLLLIVDQFEEVFRFNLYTNDPEKVEQVTEFVNMLLGLAKNKEAPIYVALTMRSDFLGDCDFFNGLPEALNESQYLVPRLTREHRREVIEGPIKLFRGEITSRLTDQLLNESGEAKDDLPLLQHALLRTWDEAMKQGTKVLDIKHYEAIGEIKGALKQHAEEAIDSKNTEELALTERIFQTLTQMDSNNRAIRRPAKLSVLQSITGANVADIKGIIKRFQDDGRLFLVDYAKDNPDKHFVDISHESLIRQWDRLTQWVLEEAEEVAIYTRIALRAEEFKETKEHLSGGSLERALAWVQRVNPTPAWGERHMPNIDFKEVKKFLEESKQAENKRLEAERLLQQEKQHVERERQEVEQQRELLEAQEEVIRQRARARRAYTILGVLMLLIISGALFLVTQQRDTAITERNRAQVARDSAGSALLEANYNQAQLFGQKARVAREDNRYPESWLYAIHSIHEVVADKPWHKNFINLFRETDEKKYLPVSMGAIMAPEVVPSQQWTNGSLQTIEAITDLVYSPDSRFVGIGFVDGRVRAMELRDKDGTPLEEPRKILLWPPFHQITNKTTRVSGLTEPQKQCLGRKRGYLFPDERSNYSTGILNQLESCNIPGSLHWEIIDNAPRFHEQYVWTIAYNSEGNLLASAAPDNSLFLWEFYQDQDTVTQGRLKHFLYVEDKSAMSLAFVANQDTLIAGYEDGIRFWQLNLDKSEKPAIVDSVSTNNVSVTSLAVSETTGTIALGLYDGRVGLLTNGANELAYMEGSHNNVITDLSFSPTGDSLASASRDGSLKLWSVGDAKEINSFQGHIAPVSGVTYDPRGRILASVSQDMTVRYWDVDSGTEIARFYQENSITSVAFNPNGENILYGVDGQNQLNTLRTRIYPFDDTTGFLFDIREAGINPTNNKDLIESLYESSTTNLGYVLKNGTDFVVPESSGGQIVAQGQEGMNAQGLSRSEVLTFSNVANRGFPLFGDSETILIQDGRKSASQAVFFRNDYRPPFEISFEYSIDNDEQQGWHDYTTYPADGIVLMLLKDKFAYEYQTIPAGGTQAFIPDGTGYGVRFRVFKTPEAGERIELVGPGRILRTYEPGEEGLPIYTAGDWRKVKVLVEPNNIRVVYEDEAVITWPGTLDTQYGGLGFGAATGGADAEHKIRNVVVRDL